MKKLLLVISGLVLLAPRAFSQGCAICTKTAGELGDHTARGLNNGILYLAVLPLTIIGSIGFLWWRYNRNA